MSNQNFPKEQRLKSTILINRLFKDGNSLFKYPIKLMYLKLPEEFIGCHMQFGVTVPKKMFKKATDRNLLKRRQLEAYRKTKNDLFIKLEEQNIHLIIMSIYIGKQEESYLLIEQTLNKLIRELSKKVIPQ